MNAERRVEYSFEGQPRSSKKKKRKKQTSMQRRRSSESIRTGLLDEKMENDPDDALLLYEKTLGVKWWKSVVTCGQAWEDPPCGRILRAWFLFVPVLVMVVLQVINTG